MSNSLIVTLRKRNFLVFFFIFLCFLYGFYLFVFQVENVFPRFLRSNRTMDFKINSVTSLDNSSISVPSTPKSAPEDDRKKLINLTDFEFLMNQENLCDEKKPFLLTLIVSTSNNYEKRQAIRETWAKSSTPMVHLFLLGWSEEDQKNVIKENKVNKDMIQGNFLDTYQNLTYKSVMGLKWVKYYCPSASYVLKVDDDVFVDTTALINFLTSNSSLPGKNHPIMCSVNHGMEPIRYAGTKWTVSLEDWKDDYYPDYCSGFVVLFFRDAISALYAAAQKVPYFWIDDVHVTGTVREKACIPLTPIHRLFLSRESMTKLLEAPKKFNVSFVFGPMNLAPNIIRRLYKTLNNRTT